MMAGAISRAEGSETETNTLTALALVGALMCVLAVLLVWEIITLTSSHNPGYDPTLAPSRPATTHVRPAASPEGRAPAVARRVVAPTTVPVQTSPTQVPAPRALVVQTPVTRAPVTQPPVAQPPVTQPPAQPPIVAVPYTPPAQTPTADTVAVPFVPSTPGS